MKRHWQDFPPTVRVTGAVVMLLGMTLVSLAGCGEGGQISRYTIPNEKTQGQAPLLAQQEARMLAVMIPEGEQAWFFKLIGSADQVAQRTDVFEQFIASVDFQNGRPQWELPENWQEQPGNAFREATLVIGGSDPPLEVAVSKLSIQGEPTEYLLANVNRWRGQLRLPPIDREQLPDAVRELEVNGRTATLVDLTGTVDPGSMMAPFAGGRTPLAGGAGAVPAGPLPAASAAAELSYTRPEEWEPGQRTVTRSGIRVTREAAFVVREGDAEVEITASAMPRLGNMLSQVNRWRGQIGLAPVDHSQLEKDLTPVDVGGEEGQAIVIEGEEETIQAAVVELPTATWFFKLQGDSPLAERERPRFAEFIQSIQFASADGAENGQ